MMDKVLAWYNIEEISISYIDWFVTYYLIRDWKVIEFSLRDGFVLLSKETKSGKYFMLKMICW